MMKITTKAQLYSSAGTKADSEQNDEDMFVCQHSSKPNVVNCAMCAAKVALIFVLHFQRRLYKSPHLFVPSEKCLPTISLLFVLSVKCPFKMMAFIFFFPSLSS